MFTTTNDDGTIPDYPGPSETHVDTLRATQLGFCQALITRAEAVTSIFTPLLTPVEPADIPAGDAFYRDPDANPNRQNREPRTSRAGQDASTGERCLPVGFVRVPGVGVVRVADVTGLRENLPVSVEAVLASVLDCTRTQVAFRVREILTLTVLMPNTWAHVKAGVVSFDRASYAAYRAVKANVDVPAFDERLAACRTNVSITTFRKIVRDIIATLTTPVEVNRNAHENRRVRFIRGVAGESTIAITGPTITVEAMYNRFTATARSIQKNLLTHFTTHPVSQCGPACTHPTTCNCTHCHTPDCATHTDNPCTCTTTSVRTNAMSGHTNTTNPAGRHVTDAFGLPAACTNTDADVPVSEVGVVEEILDSRLFDQLVFDVVDGAKPSTTVTARVIPTNTSKPVTVREGSPTREARFVDRWDDRNEATEAQQVQEMRLCVSMPTSAEWLKTQACLNIMIPFMHLLPNNGNTSHTSCPAHNRGATTDTVAATGGHSGNSDLTGENDRSSPGHDAMTSPDPALSHCSTKPRAEAPSDGEMPTPPPDQRFPDNSGGPDPTHHTTDTSNHHGTTASANQTGVSSGSCAHADLDDQGTSMSVNHHGTSGSTNHAGALGRVPVMVNNRFALDPYTTDQLLKGVSWVYRYFTDPTTGTVTEALPMRYKVPKALKLMLEARWETCSVPWCSTPARVCEKDHIQPFNHRDPATGGLTVAENLHPLCKRHHQAKTEGRITVSRTSDGGVEWEFPTIGTVLAYPPESLIQHNHYQRLQDYAHGTVRADSSADPSTAASERVCPSVGGLDVESVKTVGSEHTITYNPGELANSTTRSPLPELEPTPDPSNVPPPF